ncbi:hypothetical protein K438DRAFT_2031011 [Mycena galopus ATCC 62051]|nr:hypothetical protein K438DRAFT_2031011 [Mycena galopus ATCC 62051]
MDNTNLHDIDTRGAVRADTGNVAPIDRPDRSVGVDPGNLLDLETLAINPSIGHVASAARSAASEAVRTTNALALRSVTSVTRPSSVARTGDTSSMPPLLKGSVDWNETDGDFAPVTHRTHSQHGELNGNANTHDSVSVPILATEPTGAPEMRSVSLNELDALARRHEAYAALLRARLKHHTVPDVNQGQDWSDIKEYVRRTESNTPETFAGSEKTPVMAPKNWGDVSVLQNYSGANTSTHGEISVNYEDVNPIVQPGWNTGHTYSVLSPLRMSSPRTQSSGEDSRSQNAKKAETPAELPKAANEADEPIAVAPPVMAPPVAPRPQPTKQAPKAEFVSVEPQKTEIDIPVLDHAANNASEIKSRPTAEEIVVLVLKRINELHVGQGAGKEPLMARAHSPHNEGSSASTRRAPKQESPTLTA